jgi:hypothetical protein
MPASFVQNFTVANQTANTTVGTAASSAALLLTTAQTASQNTQSGSAQVRLFPDVMIVNNSSVGAQVAFGGNAVVALNTAAVVAANPATGSTQVYVPAGAMLIVSRNAQLYFSAITDSGTASLILMTGSGR